ncbi:divisome-associated lipoprotein YraP [Alishewanella sp. 16-MA]|uniref:Divisome-associated lipoprotein YraP n=2 Tax=Gammaproteobacteria TaxID=1236 RepID=A0ABS8C6Z6_9ALTE|nr:MULTISPECIES: division/outer membrane stress-associated lipid-binding lipoprotein [Gammaproteobacteria]MDP4944897.1 division/outer membrane stress-associated lipid-binding lipoprotein [Alishewanella sp.]MDP5206527.1 division/outer membrane stress-associated lipid-binding lipoprotein [Alishewanella sp. SMS9]MCB5228111.1 divisome-associated lipoprotein YraP [Alishewanella maricola]MCC5450737.1 divisome-associated lipoprotein YraP [Rheinheimera sp. UJ51]MDP5036456.1 division/outer membrane str
MMKLASVLAAILLLQGCAAAVVAGGATAVTAANDRRTLGSQIDDNGIVLKARRALGDNDITAKGSNLNVTSYNGVILLTGQAKSEQVREQAQRLVQDIASVKMVHNQIRLGNNTSLTTRTRDSWIGTKVKSKLLADDDVSGLNIKVVTENAEVFLMGLVGGPEADKAVDIARNVEGVVRVIKAFESPQ